MVSSLDSFLDQDATFHDARLLSLHIDYERRELISDRDLCVGDPDAPDEAEREKCRRGCLRLSGMAFWVVEPNAQILDGKLPWLADDGPLADAGTPLAKELTGRVPQGATAWYLYFANWNAFVYCAAERGAFEWLE